MNKITIEIKTLRDRVIKVEGKGEVIFEKKGDGSNIIYTIGCSRVQIKHNGAEPNYQCFTLSQVINDIKGLINNSFKYSLELKINDRLRDNPLIQPIQERLQKELKGLGEFKYVEDKKIIFLIKEDCVVPLFTRVSTQDNTTFYSCGRYGIPSEVYQHQLQLRRKGRPNAIIETSSTYQSIENVARQIGEMKNVKSFELVIDKRIIKARFPYILLRIQKALSEALEKVGVCPSFIIENVEYRGYKQRIDKYEQRLTSKKSTIPESSSTQTTNANQMSALLGFSSVFTTIATPILTFFPNQRGITKMNATENAINATELLPVSFNSENATSDLNLTNETMIQGGINVLSKISYALLDGLYELFSYVPLEDSSGNLTSDLNLTNGTVIQNGTLPVDDNNSNVNNLAWIIPTAIGSAAFIATAACVWWRHNVIRGTDNEASPNLVTRISNCFFSRADATQTSGSNQRQRTDERNNAEGNNVNKPLMKSV